MKAILTVIIFLFLQYDCFAQSAIAISASRLYYAEGGSKEQSFVIKNLNSNDTLNIRISVHDWNYDLFGNNKVYPAGELATSLANYLTIDSGDYITLAPDAVDTIRVTINAIPNDGVTVHTAMLYLTQIEKPHINTTSLAINMVVQVGVKIYYKNKEHTNSELQLSNFKLVKKDPQNNQSLMLSIHNSGNIWLEGVIKYELLNLDTREMIRLGNTEFFTLPADKQQVSINLPPNLKNGSYKAYALVEPITNNGINNVELIFTN